MDAAVDIQPALATAALGIKHITPVYAAVQDVGVFELEWKVPTRVLVPAGPRIVVIWTKLVRNPSQGLSHAVLHLEPGQRVGLRWRAPSSIFGAGAITVHHEAPVRYAVPVPAVAFPATPGKQQIAPPHPVDALVPLAGPPPSPAGAALGAPVAPVQPVAPVAPAGAWHPDPTGRFAHRWWDGVRWTDAVSDGATTSSDPLPGG
jgi:hypothetical protein